MKKVLILTAIAALAASAACTKVEKNTPDKAISFQVAKYVPQTKSNVVFDENEVFYTKAWFHQDASAAPQIFMQGATAAVGETIEWQSTSNEWAADRLYFWPKSGWVNFFSYAYTGTWGSNPDPVIADVDPTATPSPVANGSAKYGDSSVPSYITIPTDGDIMLAEAAYKYDAGDATLNTYTSADGITYGTVPTDVTGVPTLFHHMLSQVKFQVRFDANDAKFAKYAWNLVVNSITLKYANKGAIEVVFTYSGSKGQSWPYTTPQVGWTAKASDNATLNGLTSIGVNGGNITVSSANDTEATEGGTNGYSHVSGEGETLLDWTSVLPQNLTTTAATVSLNYTLTSYYSSNPGTVNYAQQICETVDTGDMSLDDFNTTDGGSTKLTAWNMNYKYLYTITIKPNKTVSFDPAVVEWETPVPGFYTYPND